MPGKRVNFNISERKVLLRIFDMLFILVVLHLVSQFFHFDYFTITKDKWRWVFVLLLYISVFGTIFEMYDLQKSSKIEKIATSIVVTVSITVLFYLLTPFFTPILPGNRLQILYFYLAILIALFVWRLAYLTLITSPRFYRQVLLVGETQHASKIISDFKNSDPNYNIVGIINCDVDPAKSKTIEGITEYYPEDIERIIQDKFISEIIVTGCNPELINPKIYHGLITLLENGIPIKEYTQVYENMTQRVPVQFIGKDFYRYFPFSRSNQNRLYLFFQRLSDIVISIIGILSSLFVIPFVFIGNLLGNRGPLFYTQERVGKHGRVFKIIKFRSMRMDAEAQGAVWASKNDSRATRFGRFLRYSRLDEVPQFINVLRGDMSIIGPRPERPVFVKELTKVLPYYEIRHIIKPGLTGWAQVKTRYGASVDDSLLKLQYDLYYIKHRSFLLDANIFIKTLSTIIFYRGQ